MWFRRKEKSSNNFEVLEKSINETKDYLRNEIEETNKMVDRLRRIIKYSKDDPAFMIDKSSHRNMHLLIIHNTYKLYLYIDKEEYIVELNELYDEEIDKDSAELKVENDYAYFSISSCETYAQKNYRTRHEFIIEFKKGRYVYTKVNQNTNEGE